MFSVACEIFSIFHGHGKFSINLSFDGKCVVTPNHMKIHFETVYVCAFFSSKAKLESTE